MHLNLFPIKHEASSHAPKVFGEIAAYEFFTDFCDEVICGTARNAINAEISCSVEIFRNKEAEKFVLLQPTIENAGFVTEELKELAAEASTTLEKIEKRTALEKIESFSINTTLSAFFAKRGDFERVTQLDCFGANYNETLHYMVRYNRVREAGIYLNGNGKSKINSPDSEGYTPAFYARSREMINLLATKGANFEVETIKGEKVDIFYDQPIERGRLLDPVRAETGLKKYLASSSFKEFRSNLARTSTPSSESASLNCG